MRVNLACPYEERSSAKALGARWDAAKRVWYVIDPPDLRPFARWLPADIRAFLTKPPKPEAKPRAKRRRPAQGRADHKQMKNEGPTNYSPVFIPQNIHPDDPPW